MRTLLLVCGLSLALWGCGLKGPLYLPESKPQPSKAVKTTADKPEPTRSTPP